MAKKAAKAAKEVTSTPMARTSAGLRDALFDEIDWNALLSRQIEAPLIPATST